MKFRIRLYREMKLWLVGGPVLGLFGAAAYGASRVQGHFSPGSWDRTYWEVATVVLGIVWAFGAMAMIGCTILLVCQRLEQSRFAEWFVSDD